MRARSLLARFWLPVAILSAAGYALWDPRLGLWLSRHHAVAWLVPAVMFLVSLRVPGAKLVAAVRRPGAPVASLVLVFGVFPLVGLGWQWLIGPTDAAARTAMVILAAQPATLATAAVLTQLAGGDAALAVVCTVSSQVASVVATPWLLELYVGRSVHVDTWGLAWDLVRAVLLPILAGQALRLAVHRWADRRPLALSLAAESTIVLLALMGFATARPLLQRDPLLALMALGTVGAAHATMFVLAAAVGALIGLDGAGRIGFTLASSQKTLAAGILVWQTGFPTNLLGPIFVVLYHLLQTVADSLLAPHMPRIRLGKLRPFRLTS